MHTRQNKTRGIRRKRVVNEQEEAKGSRRIKQGKVGSTVREVHQLRGGKTTLLRKITITSKLKSKVTPFLVKRKGYRWAV